MDESRPSGHTIRRNHPVMDPMRWTGFGLTCGIFFIKCINRLTD